MVLIIIRVVFLMCTFPCVVGLIIYYDDDSYLYICYTQGSIIMEMCSRDTVARSSDVGSSEYSKTNTEYRMAHSFSL